MLLWLLQALCTCLTLLSCLALKSHGSESFLYKLKMQVAYIGLRSGASLLQATARTCPDSYFWVYGKHTFLEQRSRTQANHHQTDKRFKFQNK
ncbi:hypothetical protein BDZ97DRAFT_26851 [Flammula alnicola]|nr:hypothetical protein BDZ97DRAFT_26851 [Flammula alnicola]